MDRLHLICERDVGLFSLVQQVISNIPWALKMGRIPVVCFGRNCAYWTPKGYAGKNTVWEYYFEPVIKDHGVDTVPEWMIDKVTAEPPGRETPLGDGSIASRNFGDHQKLTGLTLRIPYGRRDPSKRLRTEAQAIIRTHIRPRPYIVDKVYEFQRGILEGYPTIGVHARGTDSLVDSTKGHRANSLTLGNYSRVIDKTLSHWRQRPGRIFVATDDRASLDYFIDRYGDRVVCNSTIWHVDGDAAGAGPKGNLMPSYITKDRNVAARNGEEAVIDYLLLMHCDCLVHNGSSLARTVLLSDPWKPHVNVHLKSASIFEMLRRRHRARATHDQSC